MLIAGVLCLAAAVLLSASALVTLRTRDQSAQDLRWQARRSLVPTQLAAAAMLAAGALLAMAAGWHALPLVLVAAIGAVGTVAIGAWQAGRHAVEQADSAPACSAIAGPVAQGTTPLAEPGDCAGSCGACTLSCN